MLVYIHLEKVIEGKCSYRKWKTWYGLQSKHACETSTWHDSKTLVAPEQPSVTIRKERANIERIWCLKSYKNCTIFTIFSVIESISNFKKNKQNENAVKASDNWLISWHFWTPLLLFFSHSVVSDSLWPQGLQHARPPCPSQSPRVCSKSFHWIIDASQPSHPLLSPSPPAFNLSQHQCLFQWVTSSH